MIRSFRTISQLFSLLFNKHRFQKLIKSNRFIFRSFADFFYHGLIKVNKADY